MYVKKFLAVFATVLLSVTSMAVPAQAATKWIALTFDDGPSNPANTRAVLAALAKYDAKATFFMLGHEVRDHPRTFMRVVNAGHEIANHTWHHPDLTTVSSTKVRWQLTATQKVQGPYKGKCWRPPYGSTNSRVNTIARSLGLRKVMWDIDTRDWQRPSPTTISNRVTRNAFNGAVVLMHDGGSDGDRTAQALYIMLPKLKRMGYSFKVVPGCS